MKLIAMTAIIVAAIAVPLANGSTKRVPLGCTQAIHEARVVAHLAAQGFGVSAQMVQLIPEAARAGYNQDAAALNAVTAKLNAGTAKFKRITRQTTLHVNKFNVDAALCH